VADKTVRNDINHRLAWFAHAANSSTLSAVNVSDRSRFLGAAGQRMTGKP